MKVNKDDASELISTSSDRKTTKKFGIGDTAKIIHILRNNLYAKPIQTLVQEYLSNARDAMREANKEAIPIVVTLPTRLNCSLKIRDFGLGLTEERLENVFIRYGVSTKDKSNSETGGFGLGAKSAWAYTDSFTISSYLDGTHRSYVAHTGGSDEGFLDPNGVNPTKEGNGTEIEISLKSKIDINEFINAVYRATMFWDVKPILLGVTGKEIPEFYQKLSKEPLSKTWTLFDSDDLGSNFEYSDGEQTLGIILCIDGIPYELKGKCITPSMKKIGSMMSSGKNIVIKVQNGAVSVNASRESLSDNEGSKVHIESLGKNIVKEVKTFIETELSPKKSLSDWLFKVSELNETLSLANFAMPLSLSLPGRKYTLSSSAQGYGDRGSLDIKFTALGDGDVKICGFSRNSRRAFIERGMPLSIRFDLDDGKLNETLGVIDTENETDNKLKRKLKEGYSASRNILFFDFEEHVIKAVRDQVYEMLKEDFSNVIKTSDFVVGKREKRTRENNKDLISVKFLTPGSSANRRNGGQALLAKHAGQLNEQSIKTETDKHYYIVANKEEMNVGGLNADELYALIAYLTKQKGVSVISLTEKNAAKLLGNKQFLSFTDYVKSFKEKVLLTKPEIAALVVEHSPDYDNNLEYLFTHLDSKDDLLDERFHSAFESIKNLSKYTKEAKGCSAHTWKNLVTINDSILPKGALIAGLEVELKADYPFLEPMIEAYHFHDRNEITPEKKTAAEIKHYLNGKYLHLKASR